MTISICVNAAERPAEDGNCVALTFDDGPDQALSGQLLDILAAENVKATFCMVGKRVDAAPTLARQVAEAGHELRNHTYNHSLLPDLSIEADVAEIERTDAAIIAATGQKPRLVRPPYGLIAQSLEHALEAKGLGRPIALWDTDTFDWLHEDATWTIERASAVTPGSVILLHEIHPATIAAMPTVIGNLKARGLRLTTFTGLAECVEKMDSQAKGQAARAVDVLRLGAPHATPMSGGLIVGTLLDWRRRWEEQRAASQRPTSIN